MGGGGGDPYHGGGGVATRDTEPYIYIYMLFVIDTDEPLGPVPPERIDDLEDGRRRHFRVTGAGVLGNKLGQRGRNRKKTCIDV